MVGFYWIVIHVTSVNTYNSWKSQLGYSVFTRWILWKSQPRMGSRKS